MFSHTRGNASPTTARESLIGPPDRCKRLAASRAIVTGGQSTKVFFNLIVMAPLEFPLYLSGRHVC